MAVIIAAAGASSRANSVPDTLRDGATPVLLFDATATISTSPLARLEPDPDSTVPDSRFRAAEDSLAIPQSRSQETTLSLKLHLCLFSTYSLLHYIPNVKLTIRLRAFLPRTRDKSRLATCLPSLPARALNEGIHYRRAPKVLMALQSSTESQTRYSAV